MNVGGMSSMGWYMRFAASCFTKLDGVTFVRFFVGKLCRKMGGRFAQKEMRLHPPLSAIPVTSRLASSDLDVFAQIFIEDEYECLSHISDAEYIIDCGANVGYASVFFLTRFPTAKVVAIEPDPGNFAMLQKNTMPFGDRVTCLNMGVWSRDARLAIRRDVGDQLDWSFQVEEAHGDEPSDVDAISIPSLIERMGWSHVDLLKVDIEGSETAVFANASDDWLSKIKSTVIELHGDEATRTVTKALKPYTRRVFTHGELTVFVS